MLESENGRLQLGGHRHLLEVNGEVGEDAGVEVKQQFLRVTVVHKLMFAVGHALTRELVLQFQGDHGNAIHRQHHIDGVMVVGAVCKLPCALQDVGVIAFHQILIEVAARLEVAELDGHASVLDTVAQHVNQSVVGDIRLKHLVKLVSRLVAVKVQIALPHLRLRGLNELQQHRHIHRPLLVVGALVAFDIAAFVEQVMLNVSLEVLFLEAVAAADFDAVIGYRCCYKLSLLYIPLPER